MGRNEVITVAALIAFVILLVVIWGIDRRRRGGARRGCGGAMSGIVGTFDEIFHPEAARAVEIREVQRELPAEAPDSEDPPKQSRGGV